MADKKTEVKESVIAEVAMMSIEKMAVALTNKYRKTDKVDLDSLQDKIGKKIKGYSDESIPLQWLTGKALSEEAFEKIKGDVDKDAIVRFSRRIPTFADKEKTIYLPMEQWEVRNYVRNGHVNQFERLQKSDGLTEEESMNFREQQEGYLSTLHDIGAKKSIMTAERKAILSEKHARTQTAIRQKMVEKGIHTKALQAMVKARFGENVVVAEPPQIPA